MSTGMFEQARNHLERLKRGRRELEARKRQWPDSWSEPVRTDIDGKPLSPGAKGGYTGHDVLMDLAYLAQAWDEWKEQKATLLAGLVKNEAGLVEEIDKLAAWAWNPGLPKGDAA